MDVRPVWLEDAAAAAPCMSPWGVVGKPDRQAVSSVKALPPASPYNLPFDSSLESWPHRIKPSQHPFTKPVLCHACTLPVRCVYRRVRLSVCHNSSAAPEARKSAPVDSQHVLHTHFCLISLLRPCCKNYDACCAQCVCCIDSSHAGTGPELLL